jgi:hypothetical protein
LYVLWEVFSGTPISGMLIDQADERHLTDWLNVCCYRPNWLNTVWPN